MSSKPAILVPIGDPGGIGPEILCKVIAGGEIQPEAVPIAVGSLEALEMADQIAGTGLTFRKINNVAEALGEPGCLDVIDSDHLPAGKVTFGEATAISGKAQLDWIVEADAICRRGEAAGMLMGVINTTALELAGGWEEIEKLVEPTPFQSYLLVITGPLRVMHLVHHRHVREVCDLISKELVLDALQMTHNSFEQWGINAPRIAVSGWNPHAYGPEDQGEIAPGVEMAQQQGINAVGPISPDTVYRQNIEGQYDAVLAMSHDQGHIAIKTWGFLGNCSVTLGMPYISTSVAHGTAYDIAGKGLAKADNMLEAMKLTASLANGRGFLPRPEEAAVA
ncbi:MAG: 4-hydroxythreonine-4-phosphate dehydrogenase PdxA [Gammaproteobacteria bacterium]